MLRSNLLAVALTATLVSPALAHTGVDQVTSFSAGLAHPLRGADHILAMTALGLWAVSAGGRAMWVWPMAFVAATLAGFAAASLGLATPFVETVIALSVVALGLFVALAVKAPLWLGAAIAGLFAFFHGHAHGAEAAAESLIPYAAGFALTTAALHAGAIGLGLLAKGSAGKAALRATGGIAALSGLALMVGLT
jgi:urease accessory protein